ncbi:MAG: exosome complex RNA-binding protein Csl4 [Candidatus ainarchaeum sp.]|nr:exosome complex RNA-binding protein Csl4 [Candidatus ainarchaeum sp.]MDD3976351.1 exosome complex RNA-binding protein Csl4 [Candidatus ainarchaeum sp.]
MNQEKKIIENIPKKKIIKEGDIVFGKVLNVTDKIAIIELQTTNKNQVLTPSTTAILFVSNITNEYVEKASDLIKKDDIVKVLITEKDKYGYKVTTNNDGLGVVKANCFKCKKPLNLNTTQIKCLYCKTLQPRKVGKM